MNLQRSIYTSLRKRWQIIKAGAVLRWRQWQHRAEATDKRLLIIHLDPLGDTALLVAYLRSVGLSSSQFDLCCLEPLQEFWRTFFPDLHIFPFPGRSWNDLRQSNTCAHLRQRTYDTIVLPCVSPPGAYLASCARATKRYGLIETGRYFSGSRWLLDRVYNASANEHVIDRFRHLFGWINPQWYQLLHPPSLPRVAFTPHPLTVLLHPGGKWKPRRWPPERYWQLAEQLSQHNFHIQILIHKNETDLLQFFRPRTTTTIELIVTSTIQDLLWTLGQNHYFIGNDSGPAHCAALMGIPTLVIWGPGNENRIRPIGPKVVILKKEIECRPCQQYIFPDRCERGTNWCLQWITVSEVLHTFLNLWESTTTSANDSD